MRCVVCVCRQPTVAEIAAETSLSVPVVKTAIRAQKQVDGIHSAGGVDAGRELSRDAPRGRGVQSAHHMVAIDESGSALDVAEADMLRRCPIVILCEQPCFFLVGL